MFKYPNQYRIRTHPTHGSSDLDGANGAFEIPLKDGRRMFCIISDGLELQVPDQWEHVSVSIRTPDGSATMMPTWDDMCLAKDTFWDANDTVIQFHPAKNQYVNRHPHVLHLWRAVNYRQPTPPKVLV